ncbi:hypothetical protein [Reichenbachiella sp.]|uniref:hypothetical protein n=1 Tax=Reichenbachiella sp. TaxID=2184521 RepID=UPI003BB0CF70
MTTTLFRTNLLIFSLGLLFVTQHTMAQESISTERPTLSIGPWVLPENSLQWEQGAQYSDIKGNEWAYDAFIRASISRSAEIRFLVPTLESREVIAGVKWMMVQPRDGKLGVGFTMDVGNENGGLNLVGYRASFEKSLADNLTGYFNTGYTSGGYFGDLTLAYGIGDKVTVTGEYWHHEDWKQLHTSFIYLINSETQIDLNGGYLLDAGNDYTFGLGISRRFKYNGPRNDG